MSLQLIRKAHRRIEEHHAETDLQRFIPLIKKGHVRPRHLAPLCNVWDRIQRGEEVKVLVTAPPRHGKTETSLAGAARFIRRYPNKVVGFVAYADDVARSKSAIARQFALKAGVRLSYDSKSKSEWRTTDGGGFLACGIGGQLTSHGLDVGMMDDPYGKRQDADSVAIRGAVRSFHSSVFVGRIEPGGSEIVTHTRWNGDDLIEELAERGGYEIIHLPAVSDVDGKPCDFDDIGAKALWPERWPLVELLKKRRGLESDHDWHSLYQGDPRPRGEQLFDPARFYNLQHLPTDEYRQAIGLDFAYTAKQSSDYCVAIKAIESGGIIYLVDLHRKQQQITHYAHDLIEFRKTDPTFGYRKLDRFNDLPLGTIPSDWTDAPMLFHYGGTECGVLDLLEAEPYYLDIDAEKATADKWVRSQPLIKMWNQGRIRVPNGVPWVKPLIRELGNFRGLGDEHDDQVDMLSSIVNYFDVADIEHNPVGAEDLSRWGSTVGRGYG